jgi:hypothetical protein
MTALKQHNSKFTFGDDVSIIAIAVKGYVDSVRFDAGGVSYGVVYWYDGCRNYTWCDERELIAVGSKQ